MLFDAQMGYTVMFTSALGLILKTVFQGSVFLLLFDETLGGSFANILAMILSEDAFYSLGDHKER